MILTDAERETRTIPGIREVPSMHPFVSVPALPSLTAATTFPPDHAIRAAYAKRHPTGLPILTGGERARLGALRNRRIPGQIQRKHGEAPRLEKPVDLKKVPGVSSPPTPGFSKGASSL